MAGGGAKRSRKGEQNENEAEEPVKRPRRSERLSGLVQLDENVKQPPAPKGPAKAGKTKNAARASSAPKQRPPKKPTPRARAGARRSEPARPVRQPLAPIEDPPQAADTWGDLPEDLLICIVRQLSPQSTACMRLVCKSWQHAVVEGVQTLQSDNKWTLAQLSTAVTKFAGTTKLDLQDASGGYFGLQPLIGMHNLRHLRLNQVNGIPQQDFNNVFKRLKHLVTLALPGCITLARLNLTGFTSLQRLELTGCINLNTIVATGGLPSLEILSMRECRGINCWTFLQDLPALDFLDLAYCQSVDDSMLHLLARCPRLANLALQHCRGVTDMGAALLPAFTALQNIYLDGCSNVSENLVKALTTAAPNINVIRYSL